jgi:DNA-binding transcriptional LysR family regulator
MKPINATDEAVGQALAGVDLNLLVSLDALLAERSVTRAGIRLSITQPAMSATLARIRRLFDDEILVRDGVTMRPTRLGAAMQAPVREILARVEELVLDRSRFDPARDVRTFTIATSDYVGAILFGPVLTSLSREAPGVRLRILSSDVATSADRLERGAIDLAVLPGGLAEAHELRSQPLFDDDFVIATWRGNGDLEDPLDFPTFDRLPYLDVRLGPPPTMIGSRLEELGHRREPTVIADSFLLGASLLRGTRLVCVLPRRLARALAVAAELRLIEPPADFPSITETMWWRPDSDRDPGNRWLRDQLVRVCAGVPTP